MQAYFYLLRQPDAHQCHVITDKVKLFLQWNKGLLIVVKYVSEQFAQFLNHFLRLGLKASVQRLQGWSLPLLSTTSWADAAAHHLIHSKFAMTAVSRQSRKTIFQSFSVEMHEKLDNLIREISHAKDLTLQTPPGFRGRSGVKCQFWWIVQSCFSHPPTIHVSLEKFLATCFWCKNR